MPTKSWIEVPIDQEVEGVPTEGYDPFYFPPEGAKLVFEFTQEEFLKVFSALINGAALTYPDEWIQVVWYFQRNVEFPVSLCDEIAAAILTCEDVQLAIATLIATEGPVQDAIETLVTTSQDINNYITNVVGRLTEEQLTGELIAGSCDDAVVAGKMMALVEALDTNNKDALEVIEVGTNDEEKIATVIEGIPVVGELPFDQIIDFMQDLLEDFNENYQAASTTDRKEALARDLWCLANDQVDCVLTYEILFQFFQTRATTNLDLLATALDIVNFVRDGDFDNDQLIFDTMMAVQIAFVNAGREFFGINLPKIGALTRDALPSSIWEEWSPCVTPEGCEGGFFSDFTIDDQNWIETFDRAEYYTGSNPGWGVHASTSTRVTIRRGMAPTPTKVKITTFGPMGSGRLLQYPSLVSIAQDDTPIDNMDGTYTYEFLTLTSPTSTIIVDMGTGSIPDASRIRLICWNYD